MFVEQGFKGRSQWYNYLAGTLIIFLLFFIAQGLVGAFINFKAGQSENPVSITNAPLTEVMKASGLSPNLIVFLLLFSFAVGMVGIYIAIKFLHGRSFKSLVTVRKKIDWNKFFLSFGLMTAFIIISTLIALYYTPEDFELQFQLVPFLILFLISLVLIPIQVAFEEILFRGYLMQGLGVIFRNKWTPLILTSVLFGLMHGSNPEVDELGKVLLIYYIGTGFFLGIITLMDESLELALGFHTANNLIQILLVTSNYSVFQSPSILKEVSEPTGAWAEIIFPLLILYPLFIIIFSKKYKWTNWREKLMGKVDYPTVKLDPTKNHPQF